jgi:hypothetical protein
MTAGTRPDRSQDEIPVTAVIRYKGIAVTAMAMNIVRVTASGWTWQLDPKGGFCVRTALQSITGKP